MNLYFVQGVAEELGLQVSKWLRARPAILAGVGVIAFLVVLWAFVAVLSVFGQKNSDLVKIGGLVTLDGKPLIDATVTFKPIGGEKGSYGMTDAKGRYFLKYSKDMYGVRRGEHIVTISTGELRQVEVPIDDNSDEKKLSQGKPPRANHSEVVDKKVEVFGELVPARYNVESELRFEVQYASRDCDWEIQSR